MSDHHHHPPFIPSVWTWSKNKLFEDSLVTIPEGTPHRWHIIATILSGKSPQDIQDHYQLLVDDIEAIEAGRVELLAYREVDDVSDDVPGQLGSSASSIKKGQERKRGVPWTEEEHKLFLEGLEEYGKGDWRNISRWKVRSKTPTQVASHAQKFFLRQSNSIHRESKRKSIHDITDPNPHI